MVDCFPFLNELDVLEIRLHALAPYVERFVLAECSRTHSGNSKPLIFKENRDRFKQFNVVHIVIPVKEGDSWTLEAFGRECLLNGIKDIDSDEIILISDLDEIPDLREYSGKEGVFNHELYCYYFNCFTGLKWKGTFAVKKKNLSECYIKPELRKKYKAMLPIVGKGWHFSWIGSTEQNLYKLESFAHQELNADDYKNNIIEGRKNLTDWTNKSMKFSVKTPSGPEWLLNNKDRYPDLWT